MSSTVAFYVIDERKLPEKLPAGLTESERLAYLVEQVEKKGAKWAELEVRMPDFVNALKLIDLTMEAEGFLWVLSINHSPHKLLGSSDEVFFGYLNPEQVKDLDFAFDAFSEELESLGNTAKSADVDSEVVARILHAFRSSAHEAAKRGYGLDLIFRLPTALRGSINTDW